MNTHGSSFRGLLTALILVAAGYSVRAANVATPVPVLSLSLRGVADRTVEQGEPLSVAVRLAALKSGTTVIEIAPASGTWVDALLVELAVDKSSPVLARATVVGHPDAPHATLDRDRIAGGLWLFSSQAMQEIVPGDYIVRVRLVAAQGKGWKGEAVARAFPLKVVDSSSIPQRVSQRALSRANEALLSNRGEEAAAILDAVLKTSPDNRDVLVLRAIVAERAGNLPAALLCVKRASRGLSVEGPPPLDLYEVQTRLQAKFLLAPLEGQAFNPPAWSWPPLSVLKFSTVAPNVSVTNGSPSVPVAGVVSRPAEPSSTGGVIVPASELNDLISLADADGQWATSAMAGSQYGKTQYSPAQAVGAPNIPTVGNSPYAWCPESKNSGTDWLEVVFAKPVYATEVRVRQNDAAGAIVKIEASGPDGTTHVWWEGIDPYKPGAVRDIAWFAVRVPKTTYLVAKIKITLNLAAVSGWKEIDAVQLVGASVH